MQENLITKTLVDIVNAAENAAETSADDYTENGILYCGKCRAPKQTVIKANGALGGCVVPVKCDCHRIKEEARKEAEREEKIKKEIASFSGKRNVRTFKTDEAPDSRPSLICRRYAELFASQFKRNGSGLLLYGERGTGKTGYADSIAYELIRGGFAVARIDILQYCSNEENKAENEALSTLRTADIVILDGIGKETSNVKNSTAITALIDMLRDNNTPIIAITNIPLEVIKSEAELKKIKREAYMGAFATLRACTYPVHCTTDFLTNNIKSNFLALKSLLESEK